jgi:hypothetical protein
MYGEDPGEDAAAVLDIFWHRQQRNTEDWDHACNAPSTNGRMLCILSRLHDLDQHVGFAADGTLRGWKRR